MTATLQDLYNNIKTLFLKYFNSKEYDDTFLPEYIEKQFAYKNGRLQLPVPTLTISVTGSSFSSYNSSPFTYSGDVLIDYGDGTTETYDGGQISHTYDISGTHIVSVYGDVTALNTYCFLDKTNITSVVVNDNITNLKWGCFLGCTGLKTVDLGNSVTNLEYGCFYNCTGLTSIDLGNNVTNIGDTCFFGCTGLTSLVIPSSVTSIGGLCFRGCTGLTSLIIPSSVTSIGNDCFESTRNLTTLYLFWTNNDIITYNTSTWLKSASISTFSVPSGTTSNYTAKSYPSSMLTERSD